jgi:hypothetical protein
MAYFETKNNNLGKFWRELQSKMLLYFMDSWSTLRSFGLFCGNLVYFVAICCFFVANCCFFVAIWCILRQFGVFCGDLEYFVAICCI